MNYSFLDRSLIKQYFISNNDKLKLNTFVVDYKAICPLVNHKFKLITKNINFNRFY